MITANEAQRLFTDLRGVAREGERLIVEIIEKRAWEPLGYPSLAAAWDQEIGPDVILMTKKAKQALLGEAIRSGTVDNLPRIRGLGIGTIQWVQRQAALGVPIERTKISGDFWGEEILEMIDSAKAKGKDLGDFDEYSRLGWVLSPQRNREPDWIKKTPEKVEKFRKARERYKVSRKATIASLPSKPTTLHLNVGEAEYERIMRVMSAAGKFPSDLNTVIIAYIDRLEAELSVGV
jgi:hypothetical protein